MRSLSSRLKISDVGLPLACWASGEGEIWVTPMEASGARRDPGAPYAATRPA